MASLPVTHINHHRSSTAVLLQHQLVSSEEQIDQGIANAGELIGKTIRAAQEGSIHRTAIQRMLLRAHSAIGHALKAQWDLQVFHQECRDRLAEVDIDVVGWGDVNSPKASPEILATVERESKTA